MHSSCSTLPAAVETRAAEAVGVRDRAVPDEDAVAVVEVRVVDRHTVDRVPVVGDGERQRPGLDRVGPVDRIVAGSSRRSRHLATLIAAVLGSTAVMLLFWIVTLLAVIEISPLTFSPL